MKLQLLKESEINIFLIFFKHGNFFEILRIFRHKAVKFIEVGKIENFLPRVDNSNFRTCKRE